MTRIRRRLLIDTCVIGITLTLFISILDLTTRIFKPLEDWFYDRRASLCQHFTPPPTDKLVHIDIDDAALNSIGRWPWPRANLAILIDEIDRAGARAIALDIVFPDPSRVRIEEGPDGKLNRFDDDALLADAIKRSGKVLMPVAMDYKPERSPLYHRIVADLMNDLEITEEELNQQLLADPAKPLGTRARVSTNAFLTARREAVAARIAGELRGGDPGLPALRRRLLPRTDPDVRGSALINVLAEEYTRSQARKQLERFMIAVPPGIPPLVEYTGEHAQVPAFSAAALTSGFVNYLDRDDEGVTRSLPLLAGYRGKLFPQMDLALACTVLGADVTKVAVARDRITIPAPGGPVVIPVRSQYSHLYGRDIGLLMSVPVRGKSDWETIYDHGRFQKRALHLPIAYIWEAHTIRERIARNNASIDRAVSTILNDDAPDKLALEPARARRYAAALPGPEDTEARADIVAWTRQQLAETGLIGLLTSSDKDLDNDAQKIAQRDNLIIANTALTTLLNANRKFQRILDERRAELRERIAGKAALIGWTATSTTDYVPTPIQPACPGVVVHGMIFNAIMTGEFWRHAPAWVTFLITLAIGLVVTAANGFLKPSGAFLVTVLVGAAYLLVNGYLLFDYGNWCVGVAGPMAALGAVWATGALAGFLIEAGERARITKRFSIMFDSKLVDYFVEHPEDALNGQIREMSVIFTDLQGFTTLSEKLRERTVPILSEYLGLMVPIIQSHDGVVNKFLGDGIMCFFNAPLDDPDHALHAVRTCLDMQLELDGFADKLVAQGLPRLRMRCGVSSGPMVVGASGPAQRCDYTVLGDTVNLASRLEGANKATGTGILVSQRTAELCGDKYLFRPVGRLQVVGKSEGVMTLEPLAPADKATAEQRALAIACQKLVAAYTSRDFAACSDLANLLDEQFGPSKLGALYRRICREFQQAPPGPDFSGNLVLTEK